MNNLADSEAERKRLQYAIVNAAGLSNKKVKSKYGFSSADRTVQEVHEVLHEVTATRKSIEEITHVKETALLRSLNVTDCSDSDSSVDNSDSVTDSGSEEENTEDSSDDSIGCSRGPSENAVNGSGGAGEVGNGSGGAGSSEDAVNGSGGASEVGKGSGGAGSSEDAVNGSGGAGEVGNGSGGAGLSGDAVNGSAGAGEVGNGSGGAGSSEDAVNGSAGAGEVGGTEGIGHTGQDGRREFQLRDDQHMGETGECCMNTHQFLYVLYDCNLNWLAFAYELEQAFPNVGEHALEQLLLEFAGQLSFLNLNLNDGRIIEQSRQVYLLQRQL